MSNRSIRDERQRAGAPGRGSLFGKKKPPAASAVPPRETGAGKRRDQQIDKAMKDAGV